MPYNRKAIAPWSTEREQGIESATVDSNIETPQYLQPVVNTGNIDLNGNWIGVRTSDKTFRIDATHEAIPNGGSVLSPQSQPDFINMNGFTDLFIAIKVSNGGNLLLEAVMGPDTNTFANLTPVNAAERLRGAGGGIRGPADRLDDLFVDGSDSLTADVWTIFYLKDNLADQKNMQFKITNNSGGNSDITFAYMRLV